MTCQGIIHIAVAVSKVEVRWHCRGTVTNNNGFRGRCDLRENQLEVVGMSPVYCTRELYGNTCGPCWQAIVRPLPVRLHSVEVSTSAIPPTPLLTVVLLAIPLHWYTVQGDLVFESDATFTGCLNDNLEYGSGPGGMCGCEAWATVL